MTPKRRQSVRSVVLLLVIGLVTALALGACGGDDEKGEVEAAVRAVANAWNQRDVEGLLARGTDEWLQEEFEGTREELRQFLPEFMGEPTFTVRKISNTKVTGDTATTEVDLAFGIGIELTRFSMVKQGDVWKISGEEDLSPAIPSGVTAVDVKLFDFAFGYDPAAAAGGDVAFRLENVGQQKHEFAIVKAPEGKSLPELLEAPEELELVAQAEVEPGKQQNLVLTEALAPGRYAVVCFLPDVNDPEGTPHAFKGMVSEFTVR